MHDADICPSCEGRDGPIVENEWVASVIVEHWKSSKAASNFVDSRNQAGELRYSVIQRNARNVRSERKKVHVRNKRKKRK